MLSLAYSRHILAIMASSSSVEGIVRVDVIPFVLLRDSIMVGVLLPDEADGIRVGDDRDVDGRIV